MTHDMKSAFEQYQAGNVQQAEPLCREILKSQPDNADILHLLGLICYERGEYDAAERHIVRSLQSNSSNATAHCNLGNVWKSKGLPDKAISSYLNAIRLAPHAPEAFNNIGMVFLETEQPDEAISCYNTLEFGSKFHEAFDFLVSAYKEQNILGPLSLERKQQTGQILEV
jgi:protein O-GlcNAc transferase